MAGVELIKPDISEVWATSSATISPPPPTKRLINKPAIIGPVEASPTRPKESSSLFSPLRFATPSPKAIIKGVVIAPVGCT